MSLELESDLKAAERLWEQILEIVELNAGMEDAVLGVEAVEEEASTNVAVVDADLEVVEDSFAAGFGGEGDMNAEREELLEEGTTAAVGEEHSAAAAAVALVEDIQCCRPAEELFTTVLVAY